jgi:sugar O-acyltransferase (sialic acid O-acetyltransferase NeuD family)
MNLLVYCAGGFGREVADIAQRINAAHKRWDEIAFIDDGVDGASPDGFQTYNMTIAVKKFGAREMEAVIANGEPYVRKVLLAKLEAFDIGLATLVDRTAVVSQTASIGAGSVIFPNCYVSSQALISRNVAIIAGSMVGHDSRVGENCAISGHVNIGGACKIGSETYIGMGAQLKEGTSIGTGTIIGMGSIVFADVPDEVIAMGNPCRPLRPNTMKRVFKKEPRNGE